MFTLQTLPASGEAFDDPVGQVSGFSLHAGVAASLPLSDPQDFEDAKRGLIASDPELRVVDVANKLGYSDQANFTRMFRRIGGITPGQFLNIPLGEEPEFGPS